MNKYISTLALCSILGLATGCKLEAGSGQYISQDTTRCLATKM